MLIISIQLIYYADELEKELSIIGILFFEFSKFFFLIKAHIYVLSILVVLLLNLFFLQNFEIHIQIINFITISLFFFYHSIQNARDMFNVTQFKETKQSLGFNENHNLAKNKEILLELVKYEDKYFFKNKKYRINLWLILKRKLKNKSTFVINNKESKSYNKITRFNRGYATIEMQFIRNVAMYPDTYRYTIRRKLFVECIYTRYFFKALHAQQKRYQNYNFKELKYKILELFLIKIYNTNSDIDKLKLYELLSKQSKHSLEFYLIDSSKKSN